MKLKLALIAAIVCLAFAGLVVVRAQSGGGYGLSWNTIDGGGGTSSSGAYTLGGAIGQPDAGVLRSGDYTLAGGFWQSGESVELPAHHIFLPLVLR